MKFFYILLLVPLAAFSQAKNAQKIDLIAICMDKPIEQSLIIVDDGFCQHFMQKESEYMVKETLLQTDKAFSLDPYNCYDVKQPEAEVPMLKPSDKWKIRFYASHSYTTYFSSDVTFRSTRYNVEIKDYEWAERGSRKYFNPETWKEEGNNPFQMIDEPTNTFTLSIEKDGHEFFLSAFHPKFLQEENQVKYMEGTIDGVAVAGFQDVNKPFDGYNQTPGESELVRNQNTHKQMTFEVGYGYRFKLLDTKVGSINYVPSIGLGVMVGENLSVMIKEGDWWEFNDGLDKYGIQGFGGSFTNRIELNTPKERFGIFYENKLGFYKQHHGFMDGTQKYNLGFMGNSVGMKFTIYNPNNREKKKIAADQIGAP